MVPHSHGKVLLVGLNMKGPVVLERRWACRHLYPHFRQVLPIGKTQAVLFVRLIGPAAWVGSTYAGDARACADTAVRTSG